MNPNQPNTTGIKIGLPNASNKETIFDTQLTKAEDSAEKVLGFIGDWLEYLWLGCFLLFSLMLMIAPIIFFSQEVVQDSDWVFGLIAFILGIFGFKVCFCALFCYKHNRIYITTQGIGFERRAWFRMQKEFFNFGEAGLKVKVLSGGILASDIIVYYISYPIPKQISIFKRAYTKRYCIKLYSGNALTITKETMNFIRQKTKESLDIQGIDTQEYRLDKVIGGYCV